MKISMLLYNDFVNDIRVHKEARDLAAAGHSVLVIATRTVPGLAEEEERSGYRIRRVPLSAGWRTELRGSFNRVARERPGSPAGRAIDAVRRNRLRRAWVSERMRTRFARGAVPLVEAWHPDAVHAHDLDVLAPAARAAERLGVPLVYDSHELWRANNFLLKAHPVIRRRWQRMESRLIHRASAVILTEESRAEKIREWYPGVDPIVVMNCQDGKSIPRTRALRDRLGIGDDRRILLYQGLLHADRGIFVTLDALTELPESFVFVAIGQGQDAPLLSRRIASRGLSGRAYHVPAVHHEELTALTASADYGLSLVQNTSLSYYLSAPNKIFEFMQAGLPMVASDVPEVRRIWEEADLGERVDPSDPSAVARAVLTLEGDPTRRAAIEANARRLVRERYNWQGQMRNLLAVYERLGARASATPANRTPAPRD